MTAYTLKDYQANPEVRPEVDALLELYEIRDAVGIVVGPIRRVVVGEVGVLDLSQGQEHEGRDHPCLPGTRRANGRST